MTGLGSIDSILAFAIDEEQKASDFYASLARRMPRPSMKAIFEGFSAEELGHKAKLLAVRDGKRLISSEEKVQDLKIGDYMVDVDAGVEELDYQKALIVAMKKEKAAFRLYSDLATRTDQPEVRDILLSLANEEAKHKLRFEVEYDEVILKEN